MRSGLNFVQPRDEVSPISGGELAHGIATYNNADVLFRGGKY